MRNHPSSPSRPVLVAGILLALFGLGLTAPAALFAQTPGPVDTTVVVLPEITIDAARATETTASAPFAVALQARGPERVAFEPGLSLNAVLRSLPGVWINDRGQLAMGERISVRGLGARAAFGVRGVQIVLDGIPLTLPDGQAMEDVVDPAVIRGAELIRGPASLFWGNGSGGVLFLTTDAGGDDAFLRVRGLGGSYGQRQLLAEGRAVAANHRFQGFVSGLRQDGYRLHSAGTRTRAGLVGSVDLGERTRLRLAGAAAVQDVLNPGSLTRAEMEATPSAARPGYPDLNAGKQSTQLQAGLTLDHEMAAGLLSTTAYGIYRDLDNPLPFAYIAFGRSVAGVRTALRGGGGPLEWGVGVDAAVQRDDRRNFENVNGEPGDERRLDQVEQVADLGAFATAGLRLAPRLHATAGLRATRIRFAMEDALLENGDQSGERLFTAWSPSAGLSYDAGPALLFANYSTAFETPTTTELVNRPEMTGGFNPELQPQQARGFEVGTRGVLAPARLWYDLALFHLWVEDRLVSFENAAGREFYRNAGENTHQGFEAALQWVPRREIELAATYTGARYLFREAELEGNRLPGVPTHRLFGSATARPGAAWARLEVEAVSAYFVDDANTQMNDAYAVVDLQAGHDGLAFGAVRVQPFAEVRNLFDVRYSGSVLVNAFRGRYYEPAPGRSLTLGLQLLLD